MKNIKVVMWIPYVGFLAGLFTKNGVGELLEEDSSIDWVTINGCYHGLCIFIAIIYFKII